MRISDWSSDVCSSDLARGAAQAPPCAEKNDALQDPADQRENHQKDKPPPGAHLSHGHRCRMRRLQQSGRRCGHDPKCRSLRNIGEQDGCKHDDDQIGRATSELQSLMRISYAVFCLKQKKHNLTHTHLQLATNASATAHATIST